MEDDHIEFDTDQQGLPSASASSYGSKYDSQFTSRTVFGQQEVPGMAAWLIRKGIISNESQAKALLISLVCINFIIAALVIYFFVLK
jgi:hypothetical protein